MEEIIATQDFLKPPVRYSQASLVKKLEEMGIGRPSTYVNNIKKIIDRAYVKIDDCAGVKKEIVTFGITSKNNKITETKSSVTLGKEKKKLFQLIWEDP